MTKTSIRLAYVQSKYARGSAQDIALDTLKRDVAPLKKDLFERIRKAVQTATRELWLDVWDADSRDEDGVDAEGVAYINVKIAISQFRTVPKVLVVENAVQRALKKIEGGYTGVVNPAETDIDEEDDDFITVYVLAKITKAST